ncbi:MAG: hypothetical protein U9P70_05330 [Patescibacteria group bacterium]|nr:hypothetical protein [Patescibacteria group bacterium]
MLKLKKESEGVFELILNLLLPIWLPIKAISMMIKEIREERKKRREMEEK